MEQMKNQKNTVLIIVSFAVFIIPLMGISVNVALPSIGADLNVDAVLLNWIVTAFVMGSAIAVVPFGRVADIYGRKKIFLMGASLCTLSCFGIIFVKTVILLIIFRALQGVGMAMILGSSIAMLTSVFPAKERGKAIGINVGAVYLGQTIAPLSGGLITQYFGWRAIFIFSVPLGLILVILIIWKIKQEWNDARGETFDYRGSILYSLTLICLIFGFSSLPSIPGIILLIISAAGFYLFIKLENNTVHPIINIALFKNNKALTLSAASTFINNGATFGVTLMMSLYLQYIQGFSVKDAGFILLVQPALQAILSPLAGRIATKHPPRVVASLGMAVSAVGLIILIFFNQNTHVAYIILSSAILGAGCAFFASPNTTAIMGSVEKEYYGIASATLATTRQVGMTVFINPSDCVVWR